MKGKITVTSSGYNPDLPKGHPDHYDPTLGPTKPRRWTAGQLADVLASLPRDTPIVGMGDDGSGYTLAVCCEMIVMTAEKLNEAKAPYSGLQWPANHLVIVPIEPAIG